MLNTTGMYSKAADYVRNTMNPDKIDLNELDPATFAIQFYDRLYAEVEIDGETMPMQSEPIKDSVSPLIFIKGELLNHNELAQEYPEAAIKIIPQMEQTNSSHVVRVMGTFKPFSNERDIFWKPQYKELYYERFPYARSRS
jgi:hypothetical protein